MAQSSPDTGAWKQASSEVPGLRGGEAPRPTPAGYGPEDEPFTRTISRKALLGRMERLRAPSPSGGRASS